MFSMMDNVSDNATIMLQSTVVPSGTTSQNGPSAIQPSTASTEDIQLSSSNDKQPSTSTLTTVNASPDTTNINGTTPTSTTSTSMEIDQTSAAAFPSSSTISQNSTKSFPSQSIPDSTQLKRPNFPHMSSGAGYLTEKSQPNSMSTAVVAPASSSISTNSQPILTIQTSLDSSSAPLLDGAHIICATESKEKLEQKIVSEILENPLLSAIEAEILVRTRYNYQQSLSSHTTSTSKAISTSSTSLLNDTSCHCLVVDETKLDENSRKIYQQILSLQESPNQVLEQVKLWLNNDQIIISAAYVTFDVLGLGLLASPALVTKQTFPASYNAI
jgi:hypothetical protein